MATQYNFTVDQGTDFYIAISLSNTDISAANLSGYTITSEFKKDYASSNSYSFTCGIQDSNNKIIFLSASTDDTFDLDSGRYVYDVIATDESGKRTRVREGLVTLSAEVTE